VTDSPALQPLHSLPHPLHRLRGSLSLIPTVTNCRDSQAIIGRAPQRQAARGRDAPHVGPDRNSTARLRTVPDTSITARGSACRRGQALGREASPGQNAGIIREHGHFPTAPLRWRSVSPFGKLADLTAQTRLVRPFAVRLRAGLAAAPRTPSRRRPGAPFRRRRVRSLGRALRCAPGRQTRHSERWLRGSVGMKDQPTLRFSLRCEAGCRLCFPGWKHK
jgi:hypothetical protein